MTVATQRGGAAGTQYSSTSLADVIDTILDKGLVIDAYVRVSLVGIEVLTVDARVVIASVDTYLRFAEAVNRLDISAEKQGLPGLVGDMEKGGAKNKVQGAAEGILEAATSRIRGGGQPSGHKPSRERTARDEDR
jgi:gas vesicle structural protein